MKTYKKIHLLLNLIPFILAAILFTKMPDQLPTHWNISGEADGYSSKIFALIGLPLILIGINAIVILIINRDPKNTEENIAAKKIFFSIIPIMTIVIQIITILAGFDIGVNVGAVIGILIGLIFIACGKYLPTIKQNYTMGIRTPWTLDNEDVWIKTHILGGRCFSIAGIISIIACFLPMELYAIIFFTAIIIVCLIPVIYSFILFTKTKKEQ